MAGYSRVLLLLVQVVNVSRTLEDDYGTKAIRGCFVTRTGSYYASRMLEDDYGTSDSKASFAYST